MKNRMKRKGQIWTTDFMTGLALFIVIIFVIFKILGSLSINDSQPTTYRDAIHISSSLVSQGYPSNWTNETVLLPGIASSNRINDTQLDEYMKIPYERTKILYHISSEYIFFFSNGTNIINDSQCLYGYPIAIDADCNPQLNTITYADMSKIDRLVILNNTVVRMTIYAWN